MSDQLTAPDVDLLFDIADDVLAAALDGRRPNAPSADDLPSSLREPAGVFVTLLVRGELNGCIGSIDGDEPLGVAVARLALSAAFADYRLPPLRRADYGALTIELSLLSPMEPIGVASREELIAQLRPRTDGLMIRAGASQGLFLPKVWEQLPDPDEFLDHLWAKAGLAPRSWPPGIKASRFTARNYARPAGREVGVRRSR